MCHYRFEPLGARISRHLEVMQNTLGLQGISYRVASPKGLDVNLLPTNTPLPKNLNWC